MTQSTSCPCDGETLFGFTVKSCDKPAIHHRWNTQHEQYDFCDMHNYFYEHGHYAEDSAEKTADREDKQ